MKSIKLICCLLLVAVSGVSSAQIRERGSNLENRVFDLERQLDQVSRRLERLERDNYNPRPPVYQERDTVSCLVTDNLIFKTFLGEGRTDIEAEVEAKKNCQKSVASQYCDQKVKCSSGFKDPSYSAVMCMVTDELLKKSYKGEGRNEIVAEALAKQECQKSVASQYCGKVTPRCTKF